MPGGSVEAVDRVRERRPLLEPAPGKCCIKEASIN
jgi:hypothetical protein